MRVLLDECVPRALRKELLGHEVKTVAEAGWAGVKNGELRQLAAGQFDLLLTFDCNLEYQQNFAGVALAVIVIHAPSNDVAVLRPLMPAALARAKRTRHDPNSSIWNSRYGPKRHQQSSGRAPRSALADGGGFHSDAARRSKVCRLK